MADTTKAALQALGFTEMEADVYALISRQPDITGYKAAKDMGRPVANVYQAIDNLAAKGALLLEEGANRTCRAVPIGEVAAVLQRRIQQAAAVVESALQEVAPKQDDRVYQLQTTDQVYEKARVMLANAVHVAVINLYPSAVIELKEAIESAAERGVRVVAKLYEPTELRGAEVYYHVGPGTALETLPGTSVTLITDGAELVIASINPQGTVRQAIWSRSPMLAYFFHTACVGVISLAGVSALLAQITDIDQLNRLIDPIRSEIRPETPQIFDRHFPSFRELYFAEGLTALRQRTDGEER